MRAKFTPSVKFFHLLLAVAFVFNMISPSLAQDVDLKLPKPSQIKPISKVYSPAMIRAVTVNPNDPFLFDFIIDKGDSNLSAQAFEEETQKLVKYFLAALTIPENDLWVNLSPYEQDKMGSQVLGVTELGKDLLIQDYYLKQVTAALTNPNTDTGKKFWSLAYAKAKELYGNVDVPINTFSKVWIVPDQAVVLEKDGSAFIADSHLKVYLDQDYAAIRKNLDNAEIGTDKLGNDQAQDINNFSAQIIKEVVLPEIEKEVNSGENFASVRQIYNSAILAAWYKKRLKESLLGKLYADQNKVAGVNAEDMQSGDKIFEKYTAALKTGAYNIVKQDYDLSTQKIVQRKYFSGGANFQDIVETTKFITLPASGAMNTSTIAALPAVAQFKMTEIARSISSIGQSGVPANASSNIVVASFSLRPSASSTVATVARTLTPALASAPTTVVLTAADEARINGLAGITNGNLDVVISQFGNSNRGVINEARRAIETARTEDPGITALQLAQLPGVKAVLPVLRNNPALSHAVTTYDAPVTSTQGFVALAQSLQNADGSLDETKFNQQIDAYNRATPTKEVGGQIVDTQINDSERAQLKAAVVVYQSLQANSTTAQEQAPLKLLARSASNETVRAAVNILSKKVEFAAERQLNSGRQETNKDIVELASAIQAVTQLSSKEIETIALSTGMSATRIQEINTELKNPDLKAMSVVDFMATAPQTTEAIINNTDFNFAISQQSLAQTNPPQAITILAASDYYESFMAMPDTQMQSRIARFLQSEGKNAEQSQAQAQKFMRTFTSLQGDETLRGNLKSVPTLRFAAGRENDKQKAADINAMADVLQRIETSGQLKDIAQGYTPTTIVDQQIRQAAGFSREEFVARVRSNAPGITAEKANATFDALQQVITSQPQAFKSYADFGKAIHAATVATPNSANTSRENLQIITLAAARTNNIPISNTVAYIHNLFAPNVDDAALTKSVVSALPDSNYTNQEKNAVASGLINLKEKARIDESFATKIAFVKDMGEFKEIVFKDGNLTPEQRSAFENLNAQDIKNVGGIDLSAERMDLKIKRDGNGVVLPIADQDLQNLRIDGLTPVLLNVAPATPASVPFLMNLGNAAQGK
ncbi:MAG: hypothetical protein H6753_04810 [Candidatus Omnitrophica bacterium]|nr:hypothetical protein [Candidatus Omnitrophota bacterium]